MLDDRALTFVLKSLPPPPARVLEIGAGDGALAEELGNHGYDVLAIDPAGASTRVQQVPLLEVDAPPASFDAAVAVVSLHHVEPLADSCRHLGSLVRARGPLVIDEFDIASFDQTAARWWLDQGPETHGREDHDPGAISAGLRAHLHPLERIIATLEPWFEFSEVERGPYLYRWNLPAGARALEERAIDGGQVPATGARVVGRRRSGPRVG